MRYETFASFAKRNWYHPTELAHAGILQNFVYAESAVHLFTTRGGSVQHRSVVHGRDFRFPFMSIEDVMVGAVWTAPQVRGKGLAGMMLSRIIQSTDCLGSFWYVTEASNLASIRVAEKAGFACVGRGLKVPRFRRGELGSYVIKGVSEE